MAKGIWVDGTLSEEELAKLQQLIREAILGARNNTLPLNYSDEKITFKAFIQYGQLIVWYGWNFPPKNLWVQETRDFEECLKCVPNGSAGAPAREAWCLKMGYNFSKCPYGVKTPASRMPDAW